jgi:hypothetical protein
LITETASEKLNVPQALSSFLLVRAELKNRSLKCGSTRNNID